MEKEASIASLKNIKGEVSWNLVWRRRLFEWEKILLQEMLALLNSISLSGVDDRWGWRPKKGEDYSVKSTYDLVSDLFITRENIPLDRKSAFKAIWKCPAPSKVSGFVWLVLHDRVPTRVNLCRRQITLEEGNYRCVFCGEEDETTAHLFVYCNRVIKVWRCIFVWLGMDFMLPHSILSILK
jgi:hypothetical protein